MPRFAEFLALVAGRVPLLVEIKDQDGALGPDVGALEARVAALLAGYPGEAALMSFNPHSVAAFASLAPDRPRGLTTCAFDTADWSLPDYRRAELAALTDAERTGAAFVSHDRKDLDNPAVARLKARRPADPHLDGAERRAGGRGAARRRQRHLRGLPRRPARLTRGAIRPCHCRREQAMDGSESIEISVLGGLDEIEAAEWDACAGAVPGTRRPIPSPPTASCAPSRPRARSGAAAAGRRGISSRAIGRAARSR